MNFVFTDEQDQLRDSVRRFLEETSPEAEVRRVMETSEGIDLHVWKQMAEMGLHGIAIPEAYGGQGFSPVELGIVLEEMGRRLICTPFFSSVVLGATAILEAGSEEQKRALLPAIAEGTQRATLALVEAEGSWDPGEVSLSASGSGSWDLSGEKCFVLDGHTADLIVVAARTGSAATDPVALFIVQGDADGLTRSPLETMDPTRKLATISFSNTPAELLGDAADGSAALAKTLDIASACLANEMVGGAQVALDMAVQYAKDRVQFGRAIGSFQAIKHKCADMLLSVEASKSAAYYATWTAAESPDELPVVAPMAKAHASEAYVLCTAENIQIHGGIGFTWEHPAHLYFKRAKSSQLYLGNESFHYAQLADRVGF
jgi:alkylation response protein AidB-like acyl-CoA dehydrogenase